MRIVEQLPSAIGPRKKIIKEAHTKKERLLLRNEHAWDLYFSQRQGRIRAPSSTLVDHGHHLEIEIPKGSFLVDDSQELRASKTYTSLVPDLIDILMELRETEGLSLPNDKRLVSLLSYPFALHKIWEIKARRDATFTRRRKSFRTQDLLDIIHTKPIERMGLAHGDFSPHHVLRTEEGYYLFNAGRSSVKFPLHYDVAVAATRIYTEYGSSIAGKELLARYVDQYKGKEKDRVKKELYPLLAIVAITDAKDGLGYKELLPYIQLSREIRRGIIII